jgi:peptide/nickel transport system substrate-binding protein
MKWLLPVLMLFLTACASQSSVYEPELGASTLVYGLTLQPSGFDPHINSSSELGIPLRSVYDTLVYREPGTGAIVAGLAQQWSVSDDGLTYTFNLRPDVRFHDDTPFNARAVAANLDRILSPDTASQKAAFLLGPFQDYEIVDDYTIRLRLTEPYSPLLDGLAQVYLGMASPQALAEYSLDRYQFHQVGTGPYTFVDYVPGESLTLRRNPAYTWGPAFMQASENAPDTIIFRFFEDPPSRALALQGGQAQVMGELLPSDARNMATNTDLGILPVSIPGQPLQFFLNTRVYPTDDVQVRRALLLAANRDAIIDGVYQRFSPVAWGPLSASTQHYSPAVAGRYAFDPTQARVLLSEAGLADNDGNGYLDFGGADINLTMIVPPWGLIPQVAQYLQQQWREVGIRLTLEQVPSRAALFEALNGGSYNLAAFYEFGADPAFLSRYFTTGAANNWSGVADASLDALLSEAARQSDPAARASLYAQAQSAIMDQALILPIRDYVNLNGYRRELSGLAFDAYGWYPMLSQMEIAGG